jgi:hypothetical protein
MGQALGSGRSFPDSLIAARTCRSNLETKAFRSRGVARRLGEPAYTPDLMSILCRI